MPTAIKAIIPPKFNDQAMYQVLRDAAQGFGKFLVKDFERTTNGWRMAKPTFTAVTQIQGNKIYTFVRLSGDKKAIEVWHYLDRGTKPHIIKPKNPKGRLVFNSQYQRGSVPGQLDTFRSSSGGEKIYAKEVHHPGTEAREWGETIAKNEQQTYARWMEGKMSEAARASGHGMTK